MEAKIETNTVKLIGHVVSGSITQPGYIHGISPTLIKIGTPICKSVILQCVNTNGSNYYLENKYDSIRLEIFEMWSDNTLTAKKTILISGYDYISRILPKIPEFTEPNEYLSEVELKFIVKDFDRSYDKFLEIRKHFNSRFNQTDLLNIMGRKGR